MKNENVNCLSCFGRNDDGIHEYDNEVNLWYCPALDEGENNGD